MVEFIRFSGYMYINFRNIPLCFSHYFENVFRFKEMPRKTGLFDPRNVIYSRKENPRCTPSQTQFVLKYSFNILQ